VAELEERTSSPPPRQNVILPQKVEAELKSKSISYLPFLNIIDKSKIKTYNEIDNILHIELHDGSVWTTRAMLN
jgi:hypothetical protein